MHGDEYNVTRASWLHISSCGTEEFPAAISVTRAVHKLSFLLDQKLAADHAA